MSSSSTEEIPECIREIFDNPLPEAWFDVYYIARDSKIIAQHKFLFKGRDINYKQECVSQADGIFAEVYVIFEGRTARRVPRKGYPLREVTLGQRFYISITGEIIP